MFIELAVTPFILVGAILSLPTVLIDSFITWLVTPSSMWRPTTSTNRPCNARKTVVTLCPDLDKVSAFMRTVFEVDLQDHFVVVVDSAEQVSQFDPDLVVVADLESLETVREAVATPLVWIHD